MDAGDLGFRVHFARPGAILHRLPRDDPADLAAIINGEAGSGDVVICLGAGSITNWANQLPEDLAALRGAGREARI